MKKRQWMVCSPGLWWKNGKWHVEPSEGCSNYAMPKTKAGALRIARKAGSSVTEVFCRVSSQSRRFPAGYTVNIKWK